MGFAIRARLCVQATSLIGAVLNVSPSETAT